MEVCFLASGGRVAVLNPDEFDGKSAMVVKQTLAAHVGLSRFRLRLFADDGPEIQDTEVFGLETARVNLVKLEFWQPDAPQVDEIMDAIEDNDVVAMAQWLQRPVDPNITDGNKWTPLLFAARNEQIQVMKLLLEAGAQVDLHEPRHGQTPLHLAGLSGHVDAVRFLLEAGASKDSTDNEGVTPLLRSASAGHPDVVRVLLDAGAGNDIAASEALDGATPLVISAMRGHLEVVRVLLDAGAASNCASLAGVTPLNAAALRGHLDVVRLLLLSGASADDATLNSAPPLFIAAASGHLGLVRLLVEHGAECDTVTDALAAASKRGHVEVVRFLAEIQADSRPTKVRRIGPDR